MKRKRNTMTYCTMKMNFFFVFQNHFNRVRVVVFNAISINISAITWRSVLLVGETGENHRYVLSRRQMSHIMFHLVLFAMFGIQTHTFSGYRYWLYRQLSINDGPHVNGLTLQPTHNLITKWIIKIGNSCPYSVCKKVTMLWNMY